LSFIVKGVRLRIEFSFLVFSAMIFLLRGAETALVFFAVCLIHEFGHAAVLFASGGRLSELIFLGAGIKMLPDRNKIISIRWETAILLAGPLLNIIIFLVLERISHRNCFAMMNLYAAVFNLLPYSSLDGGAALRLIMGCSEFAGIFLSFLQVIPLFVIGYAMVFINNLFFLPFCIVLFYFLGEF